MFLKKKRKNKDEDDDLNKVGDNQCTATTRLEHASDSPISFKLTIPTCSLILLTDHLFLSEIVLDDLVKFTINKQNFMMQLMSSRFDEKLSN